MEINFKIIIFLDLMPENLPRLVQFFIFFCFRLKEFGWNSLNNQKAENEHVNFIKECNFTRTVALIHESLLTSTLISCLYIFGEKKRKQMDSGSQGIAQANVFFSLSGQLGKPKKVQIGVAHPLPTLPIELFSISTFLILLLSKNKPIT